MLLTCLLLLAAFVYQLPFVYGLWRDLRTNYGLRKRGVSTIGRLVGFTIPEHSHHAGAPVATYVVDGVRYTVNDNGNIAPEGPFRGRPLTVCYDPANPANAIVRTPFDSAEPALLAWLCVVQAALITGAIVAFVKLLSSS